MKHSVIFVNPLVIPRDGRFVVDGPTYVGQLACNTLRSHGIDCQLPVARRLRRRSAPAALAEILVRVLRCCRPDCLNVIGVTSWTFTAQAAAVLMHYVRQECEARRVPVLIVGGGPFFARDGDGPDAGRFRDSIDITLSWGADEDRRSPYDGIVDGGLRAFLQLLDAVEADAFGQRDGRLIPEKAPEGYYYREGHELRGKGRAATATTALPPVCVAVGPAGYDLVLMFSSCCANACDYCRLGQRHRFAPLAIGQAIRETGPARARCSRGHARGQLGYLKLLDPNPFAPPNLPHTAACLEEVRSVLGVAPRVHCYCDSHAFTAPGRLLHDLNRFNVRRVFVGREAIGEPGLSFIGRRLSGSLRTAAMVAEERAGIEETIRKAREAGTELRLAISYIVSPVDTPASLGLMLTEMEAFLALSGGSVQVNVQWELLWPSPGTHVLRRHRELVSDDPYFVASARQAWNAQAIAARYPESVFGRPGSEACDGLAPGASGLQHLIESVA